MWNALPVNVTTKSCLAQQRDLQPDGIAEQIAAGSEKRGVAAANRSRWHLSG